MASNHNTVILTNSDQFAKFNILDYSERLEIIGETAYHIEILCPVCQAENFKITKKTGQYFSYSCNCMESDEGRKDVIKAVLGPDWKDYSYSPYSQHPQGKRKSVNQQKATSAKINKIESSDHGLCFNIKSDVTITLGKLEQIPEDYPKPVKGGYIPMDIIATANKAGATRSQIEEITYQYSPTQFVKRFQWPDKESSKGQSKSFRQCHINDEGKMMWKKGEADWPFYRQAEAIKTGGWLLFQEGEKCVEASRSLGIASITTQGGNWDKTNLSKSLKPLQEANVPGIVFISDNDDAGMKKATTLLEASLDLNFPVIVIRIAQLWPEAPEAGDLADWITWGKTNNMYNPDYISRLEAEMHRAVNERERQRKEQNLPFLTEEDQEAKTLEILVKAFAEEKDPFKQTIKRKVFRAMGIGDRQLDQLTQYLTHNSIVPLSSRMDSLTFRSRISEGKQWLVSALIPATGVTLITAPPGGSKSTFMFDLAGSILCGNSFMGEDIKENGPIIFACSDEPLDESQERALLQGFIHSDNYEFLENWNISHMGLLEEAIADRRPRAVIIDSFDSIHREAGYDENSPNASEAIKKLNTLSQKYSCSIIVSHHENKDPKLSGVNKARGSSAIVASANAHIRIIGKDDDPESKVVKIEKLRGGATRSILCKVDYYNIRFEPEVNLEFEQDKDKRVVLINFLEANPSRFFEVQELNEYLGWTGKAIYRYLKQLTDRGEISRKPNPNGRKGMIYGYLCTKAVEANGVTQNLLTSPSLEIESKEKKEEVKTLDIKGIDHGHTLVTTELPSITLQSELVTSESQDQVSQTPETLTLSDSLTCDREEGNQPGGEVMTSLENEVVFSEDLANPVEEEAQPLEWKAVIKEMDAYIETLGWTKEKARGYVQATYRKKSRLKLTDVELLEFLHHLRNLVKAKE